MRLNLPVFVAVVGFSALIFGLFCSAFLFPKMKNYFIAKATAMEEGTKTFETWKKIPFPFKLKVYFFNVTNADEVQLGFKPILKEIGPYIYDEFREREILSVNDENDTITYIQRKNYFFNKEESGCRDEDDIVTILHFAIVSMAYKVNKISSMALPLLNTALPFLFPNIKNIFITSSVRNILFDGLKILCDSDEVDMICGGLRSKPPHTIRSDGNNRDFLLSLFHHLNGSDDGPYEIGRGLRDTIKGKILSFKNNNLLTQWKIGTPCNEIHGTDLTINPSLPKVLHKVNFFVSDFCRYLSVKFDRKMDYFGLDSYLFQSTNLFQSKENCFCEIYLSDEEELGDLPNCPPKGTMDLTPCTGSPIVISQPHFLGTEKSLLSFSQGLKPNKDKHGTSIIMEPNTGLAMKVKVRFQMNIFLKNYEDVSILKNVSQGYFPFIWIENEVVVPTEIIEEVKRNFGKLQIFDILKYLLIIGGIILLGVSLILSIVKDKFLCFDNRKNAVSIDANPQTRRFMNVNSDIKISNGFMSHA